MQQFFFLSNLMSKNYLWCVFLIKNYYSTVGTVMTETLLDISDSSGPQAYSAVFLKEQFVLYFSDDMV